MSLRASYDPQFDIFYLAEEGLAPEAVEIYPGVSLELNPTGGLIGVEVFEAAEKLLGDAIIGPLLNRGEFCKISLHGNLADLDAQLRLDLTADYLDYMEAWPEYLENDPEAVKTLEILRSGIGAILEQVKDGAVTG